MDDSGLIESDTQVKGDHAELMVATACRRYGWTVCFPFTESNQYDLIVERDGTFVRIQVKSGTYDEPSVTFQCYGSNSSKSGQNRTEYTADDIDGFAVYSHEVDRLFWVPVANSNSNTMAINVDDDGGRNPASDYSFRSRFG